MQQKLKKMESTLIISGHAQSKYLLSPWSIPTVIILSSGRVCPTCFQIAKNLILDFSNDN